MLIPDKTRFVKVTEVVHGVEKPRTTAINLDDISRFYSVRSMDGSEQSTIKLQSQPDEEVNVIESPGKIMEKIERASKTDHPIA